ncbi:MAG: hypothetical protein JW795_00990 [Chitinivibrionales bacterium]|nr:hypothetical protein [Chitinivibrionales bacterium]
MKKNVLMAPIILYFLFLNTSYANQENVKNSTLQKVLEQLTPDTDIRNTAFSARYVRTTYISQSRDDFSKNISPEVKRTTISELLISGGRVKESICDARLIGTMPKQYAFHYSDDGNHKRVYDSRFNAGTIKIQENTQNYLQIVLSPLAVTKSNRFISRTAPLLLPKFNQARVTSETVKNIEGVKRIILEGEYENCDPEHYFRIAVAPEFNYAITQLEEYDKNKHILSEINAIDYENISGLWLAKEISWIRYKHDDEDGDSVQIATLSVLEPKLITASEGMFSLSFPSDAKIYDSTTELHLNKIKEETDAIAQNAIDDIDAVEILKDKKGIEIISRTQHAYEHKETTLDVPKQGFANTHQISSYENNKLRLPKSHPSKITRRVVFVFLAFIGTIGLCLIFRALKKSKLEAEMEGGEVL